MRTNKPIAYPVAKTHEGSVVNRLSPEKELLRTISTCLLWEDSFYESGVSIAERIKELVPKCDKHFVAETAVNARTKMNLRHSPLLLAVEMVKHKSRYNQWMLENIIQRPDELCEFLALYWKDGKRPLAKQVKLGLASALGNFNEYQLAKYNRKGAVKLADVLRLCHPKPKDKDQAELWGRVLAGTLKTPDTWEVELSSGKDKKEVFERLMAERKLGALAFLRNLRNMHEAGVDPEMVEKYCRVASTDRVLPFRFIAAARAVPLWEHLIEPMMIRAMNGREPLTGRTVLLVDVSGSMKDSISSKSDLKRIDAACGLAILVRDLIPQLQIFSFSDMLAAVPARRGFALRDAITASQPNNSTYLGAAINTVHQKFNKYDRIIVITDEQSEDSIPLPLEGSKAYIINVAAYKNGVAHGPWVQISGWSESCLDYIQEHERQLTANKDRSYHFSD